MANVAEKTVEEVSAAKEEVLNTPAPAAEESAPKEDSKTDISSSDESGVTPSEKKIIRQVEYYFGDANLNRDKFLLEQIGKDDGWVPLTVLLTFKRLAALSTDVEFIVNSLRKSDEGLVEVHEAGDKLRRHPERPIPEHNEERRKEIMSRTAYAKGFPLETEMSDLLDFFGTYEKVVNINMRKYLDKPTKTYKFKGSVFVTFEKKEQTQEFVEKDKVAYKERELLRKWQEKYLEDKKEEQKSKKAKSKPVVEEEKFTLPKGAVLFFEGATEDVTREKLRETVEKLTDLQLAYIDFSKGDKTGHLRFQDEDAAGKFLEKLEEGKLKLSDDLSLSLRTLTEEEEKAFIAKAIEHMKSRRSHHNKSKGHHHHGNRKRHGGGHYNRNDEKKSKKSDD